MYREKPPADQAAERQGTTEQEDAKRTLRENEAEIRRKAAADQGMDTSESEAERTARQEDEAEERFERIAEDVSGQA
jgi:hypothetical protein